MFTTSGSPRHPLPFALSSSCCSCSCRSHPRVSLLLFFCCCACRLARKGVDPGQKGAHGRVTTLCMGRTASSGGELSLAPVVLHVEAMGLVLQFDSKMASNGCTAAYATSFSRTATFEIPRSDRVTLRACVRHLVFLNTLFSTRFPPAASATAGAHVHVFQYCCCCVALLIQWLRK
jgi:hypothetical protein